MKHYVLYYNFVPDILTARIPYMESHMKLLVEMSSKGLIFVGKEMIEGYRGLFMFEGENAEVVTDWLKNDPYFQNGIVAEHQYHEIVIVAGQLYDNTLK